MPGAGSMQHNRHNGMSVDFKAKQREFAAYIRDPEHNLPPSDVKIQRIAMYRELIFNNIDGFLSANFPVLRSILDDRQWFQLAQDFFAGHRCKTPYFPEIAEEFLDYLQNERSHAGDFPFMLELAHYEWVEMILSIAKEEVSANPENLEPLPEKTLRLSPLAWPLVYQYPVHRIAPSFLPLNPPEQPTFLVVYRNQEDEVKFIETTPGTYRLLQLLQEHASLPVADCLGQVAAELHHPDPERVIDSGLRILKYLAEKNIVTVIA